MVITKETMSSALGHSIGHYMKHGDGSDGPLYLRPALMFNKYSFHLQPSMRDYGHITDKNATRTAKTFQNNLQNAQYAKLKSKHIKFYPLCWEA